MNQRAKSYLRSIVISPEIVVILMSTGVAYFKPQWIPLISARINTSAAYLEYIYLAPIAICIWTLAEVRGILFPEKDQKQLLQKHSAYGDIRVVCNVAVYYSIFFSSTAIFAACKVFPESTGRSTFILLSSVLGSLTVAFTTWLARTAINEIFCAESNT